MTHASKYTGKSGQEGLKTVMAFNLSDTHPTFDTSQQQTVIFIVWYESGL